MASKYLNLEAAADRLSISVAELNRYREKGDIRAFADRGTWKFRVDHLEELARTLDASGDFEITNEDELLSDVPAVFDDDSNISLDEGVGEQPTIISKGPIGSPPSSDSDVRLIIDPALESDTPLPLQPSSAEQKNKDSDVRFVDEDLSHITPTPLRLGEDEDSQNKISDLDEDWLGISDSDVRLSPTGSNIIGGSDIISGDPEETIAMLPPSDDDDDDSDSDVTLLGAIGGEELSDVRLEEFESTDSDITLMPPGEDSVVRLEEFAQDDDPSVLSDLASDPVSGLSFSSGDSGISLDLAIDSGLSLEDDDDDDSITLASESGISLLPDSELGLTFDNPLSGNDDVGGATIPMLDVIEDDDANDTDFDMPLLQDSGEVFGDDEDTTNVVMFDDESDDQTMEFGSSEMGTEDEFVDFDDEDSFDELSDGELNVADDLLDDDILEADDDAFDDDFESGESVPALPLPGSARGVANASVAAEWDMVSFGLVLMSTGFMGICTLLMFDLVRSMWGYEAPIGVNGMILDTLQGIIKS